MRILTRSHVKWALIVIAFALTGIALAVLAGRQATTAERLDASRDRVAVLETQNADAQARSQALSDQVEDLGETPVVTVPEVIPGEPGATGATGSRGLTGAAGPAGEDGRSIIGPRGPVGPPGPVGADGETVVGPVGPAGKAGEAGKDGQSITGPAGPRGEQGADGKAGESIVGPVGPPGAPATCEGDFVCTAELDSALTAALANYFTRDDILALFRALGCETDKPNVVTCAITGLP